VPDLRDLIVVETRVNLLELKRERYFSFDSFADVDKRLPDN